MLLPGNYPELDDGVALSGQDATVVQPRGDDAALRGVRR
jgi:hypothetical protein